MRLSGILFSSVGVASIILSTNNQVHAQCRGGYCPIPNAYSQDQNAQYYQDNRYWQGNQNPNWQGNQTPYWRNDNGWRDGYQGDQNNYSMNQSDNSYYSGNLNSSSIANQGYQMGNNMSGSNSDTINQHSYFQNSNGQNYFYHDVSGTMAASNNGKAGSTDTLMQNKINDALKNNYLKKNYNTVNATFKNGSVTLTGIVESEDDRQDVESRVRSVDGVKDINDQLQIGALSENFSHEQPMTNEDLQQKVDNTIKNNYVKKNYDTVTATVINGVVTLQGTVDSERDRDEILNRIKKIKDIRDVHDEIKISSANNAMRN